MVFLNLCKPFSSYFQFLNFRDTNILTVFCWRKTIEKMLSSASHNHLGKKDSKYSWQKWTGYIPDFPLTAYLFSSHNCNLCSHYRKMQFSYPFQNQKTQNFLKTQTRIICLQLNSMKQLLCVFQILCRMAYIFFFHSRRACFRRIFKSNTWTDLI